MYLTSPEEQKRRAIEGALQPTIATLYKDPRDSGAVPFFGELYDTFVNAVARPSTVTGASTTRSATNSGTPSTVFCLARPRRRTAWRN